MREGAFRTSTLAVVLVVAGLSFLGALLLSVFGPEIGRPPSREASAYSESALGYRGVVEALRRAGVPVVVSRNASAHKAAAAGVLVVSEPSLQSEEEAAHFRRLLDHAPFALLVLPKWLGTPHPDRSTWVGQTSLRPVADPQRVLEVAGVGATVLRAPSTRAAELASRLDVSPSFVPGASLQVVEGSQIVPLVATAEGHAVLAGVQGRSGLFVLADPDPISNAGFHLGSNVSFFLRVLDTVRDGYASIVFDETVHGHITQPTIWRELFTFPLVLVTLHLVLVAAVLLWASTGRFGAPRAAPTPVRPGTVFLVESTAEVVRLGTPASRGLPRYLEVTLRSVRRSLDAPSSLQGEALDAWLDRVGAKRGVADTVADLRAASRGAHRVPSEALAVARRIHRWRTEILHGPFGRPHAA